MEISYYTPPPPRPSPPAKPPRKFRSAVIMSAIFLGSFVVCFAVLSRHELARMVSQHVVRTNPPEIRQSVQPSAPAVGNESTPQATPQAVQQTQATPPSVFQ